MQHGLDLCFDNITPFYCITFLETFLTWPKLDNVSGTKSWFKYFRYLESLGVQFGLTGMFPFDSHTLALDVEMYLVYTLLHTPSFGWSFSSIWKTFNFLSFWEIHFVVHLKHQSCTQVEVMTYISWEKEEQEHKVHQLFIININIFIFLEQFFLINFVI
jgi:hypothetical protein